MNFTENSNFLEGGPPNLPPKFGQKFSIGEGEEIKTDDEGMEYVGTPLKVSSSSVRDKSFSNGIIQDLRSDNT
jgi:hypothetical protein